MDEFVLFMRKFVTSGSDEDKQKDLQSFEFCKVYDGKHTVLFSGKRTEEAAKSTANGDKWLRYKGDWIIPGSWGGTFDFDFRWWDGNKPNTNNLIPPKAVKCGFENVMVSAVDTITMSFNASFTVVMSWALGRQEVKALALGVRVLRACDTSSLWTPPEPRLLNVVPDNIQRTTLPLQMKEQGMELVVTRRVQYVSTIKEPFELQAFPVDCQDLPIVMEFSTFGRAGPSIFLQPQDDSPTRSGR